MSTVIGELKEHWLGQALGTEFMEFETATMQGLASESRGKIQILAVMSKDEGKGHFRAFVNGLKDEYREVRFLQILEPAMAEILKRYGFTFFWKTGKDGEYISGMKWKR